MRKLLIWCGKKKKKSHWAYGESICLRSSDFPSLSGMQVTRINVAQPDLGSTEYYWLSLVYVEMPNPKPPHLINPLRLELQDMFRQQQPSGVPSFSMSPINSGLLHLGKQSQPSHTIKTALNFHFRIPQWNWRNAATNLELLLPLQWSHCNSLHFQLLWPLTLGFK